VKLTGDGALVEFASGLDALSAAIEFQQAMENAKRDQPSDNAIEFRIAMIVSSLEFYRPPVWREAGTLG
jgi:class 3 adenylate cyclase